jgi:hypothetical protein
MFIYHLGIFFLPIIGEEITDTLLWNIVKYIICFKGSNQWESSGCGKIAYDWFLAGIEVIDGLFVS